MSARCQCKIVRWPELELPMGFQVRDDIPITLTLRERDGPSDLNRLRGFGAESMILPALGVTASWARSFYLIARAN